MESYNEDATIANNDLHQIRDSHSNKLETKMIELNKTREELKRARDSAMQSWLDSRPLIDELEKQQSGLTSAKDRASMSSIIISELDTQLETTNMGIRSKREEELKTRTMIEELGKSLDHTQADMEKLKLEIDGERRARARPKQALRLRRQTLRMVQLKLRAIRIESEAFGASAAEAIHHIRHSEKDNITPVKLSHEEYYGLTRRAKEETALAEWRASVSMEQRLVAEASRDSALRRLKELHVDNRSKKKSMEEDKVTEEAKQKNSRTREGVRGNKVPTTFLQGHGNVISEIDRHGFPQQQLPRTRSNHTKKLVKKKKPSVLYQIKSFLVRSITKLFR